MEKQSKLESNVMTRCDQCPTWVFEHAGIKAIAEGHCQEYNSRDACDKPCEKGIQLYNLSFLKNKDL